MIIIHDTEYVTVSFDEDIKVMEVKWKDAPFNSEQYRETFEKAIEFATETPADFFISDIVKQRVVNPNDRKWFEESAIPRAAATGLKKAGVVLGSNPFKRYYFNHIMKKVGNVDLPFKAFKNREEAVKWFLS